MCKQVSDESGINKCPSRDSKKFRFLIIFEIWGEILILSGQDFSRNNRFQSKTLRGFYIGTIHPDIFFKVGLQTYATPRDEQALQPNFLTYLPSSFIGVL